MKVTAAVLSLFQRMGMAPKVNALASDGTPAFKPAVRSGADGKRELYIYGEIVDASLSMWFGDVEGFVSSIGVAHVLDSEPVDRVVINCMGGDVDEGSAIASMIRKRALPVVVDGAAFSMASVIVASSPDATMMLGSRMMLHKPWGGAQGNAQDMRATANILDTYEESMLDLYVRGNDTPERRQYFRELLAGTDGADGTWFTAAEALEAGLVDRLDGADDQVKARTARAVVFAKAVGLNPPVSKEPGNVPAPTIASPEPRQEPGTHSTVRGSVLPRGAVTLSSGVPTK